MPSGKQATTNTLLANLVYWLGVPLILAALGYFIVGPKLGSGPKAAAKAKTEVSQPEPNSTSENTPNLAANPTLVRNNSTQALASAAANSKGLSLRPRVTTPSAPVAATTQSPTPPMAASPTTPSGANMTSSGGPEVTVTVVRPVTHISSHSTRPRRKRRHHSSTVTVSKPATPTPAKPAPSDDGSFGGTEEGAPKSGN